MLVHVVPLSLWGKEQHKRLMTTATCALQALTSIKNLGHASHELAAHGARLTHKTPAAIRAGALVAAGETCVRAPCIHAHGALVQARPAATGSTRDCLRLR